MSSSLFFCNFFFFFFFVVSFYFKGVEVGKTSSFECGFDSFFNMGFTFSLPFFLVSLVFLMFDVEIILLSFYPLGVYTGGVYMYLLFLLFLILFVTFYEWVVGVLQWFLTN